MEIEVGSEWVNVKPSGEPEILKVLSPAFEYRNCQWVAISVDDEIIPEATLVDNFGTCYKPYIRTPQVGDIWEIGSSYHEIVLPVRPVHRRDEVVTWRDGIGYEILPPKLIRMNGKYIGKVGKV